MPQKHVLIGRVRAGKGHFSWVLENVDGLWALYNQKSKLSLFPGTLNIELEEEFSIPEGSTRIEAHEYKGRVSASFYPCVINGLKAIIIRTDNNESGEGDHARTIIEIAAEKMLRREFGLVDDDEVVITLIL